MKAALQHLLAAALLLSAVSGQQHPLTNLAPPLEGVETTYWLPEYPEYQFPAGALVEAVVGIHNNARERLNVTGIAGSLNNAAAFMQHFQNFSYQEQYAIVAPGDQATLAYWFRPDENFPPREFQVALTVFYHTDAANFTGTFFNRTIDITEVPSFIDVQGLFLLAALAGLLGALGYGAYALLLSRGFVKPRRAARKVEAKKAINQDDWLKGTYYQKGAKKPAVKRKPAVLKAEPVVADAAVVATPATTVTAPVVVKKGK